MTSYLCMIDLRQDAKALQFVMALSKWLGHLQRVGGIGQWRLMRRKLNLAADCYRDFLLEIEVEGLAQLDLAFNATADTDGAAEDLRNRVHDMVEHVSYALYRPYPDPQGAERAALI